MVNGARLVGAALTAVVLASVASCGGQDPYCTAVEANQSSLDSFGSDRSDAGFGAYASSLASISKVAPKTSKDDWATLAKVTEAVATAHQDVGFPLEDMDDEQKRTALSERDIKELNAAYDAFNDTAKARESVVADVKENCDLQLK